MKKIIPGSGYEPRMFCFPYKRYSTAPLMLNATDYNTASLRLNKAINGK